MGNFGRWLVQGAMGLVNMIEDYARDEGPIDPSTLETLRTVRRRIDAVITQAEGAAPEQPPPPEPRRRALRR